MNAPWPGPNPNAAAVVPFCPCPVVPKLNGDAVPPPVDVEGVTGVNTNAGSLEPLVPFVVVVEVVEVPGVLEVLKENVGLFIAGAGVDSVALEVVPKALTGVGVVPNALPFANGLGPGLEPSCLEAATGNVPCEVLVFVGVVESVGRKVTFESGPPAGLFAPKLKRD